MHTVRYVKILLAGVERIYPDVQEDTLTVATQQIKARFLHNFVKRKKEVHYDKKHFMLKNEKWLKVEFVVNLVTNLVDPYSEPNISGRPSKPFAECNGPDITKKTQFARNLIPRTY